MKRIVRKAFFKYVRESGLWVVCAIVILAICDMDSPGVVHLDLFFQVSFLLFGWRGASIFFCFLFSSFEFSNSRR